jgi:hypothetical protein
MSEEQLTEPVSLHVAGTPGDPSDEALLRVWRVLNRLDPPAALQELRNGLDASRRPNLPDGTTIAFGFDTNAVFRLGLGERGPGALDYLSSAHRGPVIVPGQAIQEVWNNLLAGVEPQAKRLRKRFDELHAEVSNIDQALGPVGDSVRESIEELARVHGDWVDPRSQEVFDSTLEMLLDVGVESFVPREGFALLARARKETKTPPGFHDPAGNHGDFYLWADFLYGLAQADRSSFDATVLVTNDARLWTLQDFHSYTKKFTS